MKVLQLGKFYPIRGGVEKVMYDLTWGLSESGVHCDMLCASTEDYPEGELLLNSRAKIMVVKTAYKLAATMLAPRMIRTLRRIAAQYDIIHVHHPDPMAALALRLSGYTGKVVLHWHSDILKQKLLLKLYKPLQDWLIKRADLILGTSPVYIEATAFLQTVQKKTDYLPIGIEPISADPVLVERIRQQYPGKKIVYALGRLVEYKGYEFLIRATKQLPDDVQVLIAGKGPLEASLKDLIAAEGVGDKVTLLGFVEDEWAHAYFQACDVFCLSSTLKTEAFAIVQIEAMSCGKPVVSTRIPGSGVSWVNQDQQSGLVVSPGNHHALGEAIRQLVEDRELYQKLAQGAKDRYVSQFNRMIMVAECRHFYQKLLGA